MDASSSSSLSDNTAPHHLSRMNISQEIILMTLSVICARYAQLKPTLVPTIYLYPF